MFLCVLLLLLLPLLLLVFLDTKINILYNSVRAQYHYTKMSGQ